MSASRDVTQPVSVQIVSSARGKRNTPGVPVLLMTGFGYDPHHSIVRATQEGLYDVLFKPFEVELMLDKVKDALSGRPSKSGS